MSDEHKAAISKGQRARHAKRRDQEDHFAVTQKRCSCCGEVKRVPDDYYMRKRTLKSGERVVSPPGECKACSRARADRWKDEFIAVHGEEAYRAKVNAWNANRNQDKKRRYNREYGRLKRLEEGAKPRGPWHRYRDEAGGKTGYVMVGASPFRQWWREQSEETKAAIRQDETLARAIRRIMTGGQPNVELETLDKVAGAVGDVGLVDLLSQGAV